MPTPQYARWQTPSIQQALRNRRIVVLAGARQCGKTTLAKTFITPDTDYRTLDDLSLMQAAMHDPQAFVVHHKQMMIIDEIQRVPLLLQALKQAVDTDQTPGRFLLTGSANIQARPGVTESLAGRIRTLRLRPLAYGEIYRHTPDFLPQAFKESFQIPNGLQHDKDTYLLEALQGGYPEPHLLSLTEAQQWYADYLNALMERDLQDLLQIRRQDSMQSLLGVLAAWSSKFIDLSAIGAKMALSRPTLQGYINALEALYIIEKIPPFLKTDYERINKHYKLFMADTGLMGTLLNWNLDNVRLDGDRNGKLIETFVFTQLMAHIEAQETRYQLYHYRDREQREIDFIIENNQEELLCVEVKASSLVTHETFKHILWFQKNVVPQKKSIGIVFYTGQHILSFGNSLWAVPISVLY